MRDNDDGMRFARTAGILAMALGLGCTSSASRQPIAAPTPVLGVAAAVLQDALDRAAREHAIPGASVAIAVGGAVAWAGATGEADLETGRRVTSATKFPIASVTKTFTSALTFMLAQQRLVDVDAPIAVWIPSYPNASRITLRHLLSHTSGLERRSEPDTPSVWTAADLASSARDRVCAPGACYRYADENFMLAGVVLREATKKEPRDLLRANILEPLGLADTSLEGPVEGDFAVWYAEDDEPLLPRVLDHTWAAGSIYSTPTDLARFISALFAERLVTPDRLPRMLDTRTTKGLPCPRNDCSKAYALGIEQTAPRGRAAWGHEGSTGSLLAYFPDKRMAIAVVQNRAPSGRTNPHTILDALLAKLPGFEERSDLYVVRADGTGTRRLTSAPLIDGTPIDFTSDGRTVTFHTNRDGNLEIYTINADGSGERRVTHEPAGDAGASRIPDGRIVFGSDRNGTRQLYVMNADGSGVGVLPGTQRGDWFPVVSPDGRRIAFVRGPEGNRDLWVMGMDGTGRRALVTDDGEQFWPTWSPDGSMIAYENADGTVRIVGLDGRRRKLPVGDRPARQPDWSPDGRWIAFMSRGDIFVVRPDGTGLRRVVDDLAADVGPAWSPDGASIVFTSNRS